MDKYLSELGAVEVFFCANEVVFVWTDTGAKVQQFFLNVRSLYR